jgi:hypothetical protein
MPSDLADYPSLPDFAKAQTVDSLAPLVAAGRRFGCIYADPRGGGAAPGVVQARLHARFLRSVRTSSLFS